MIQMSEAQLLSAVRQAALLGGWLFYHTHDSRRSEPGFVDVVLVHRRRREVVFAELKTAKGRLRPEQGMWLEALTQAGQRAEVWRPADLDWVIGMLTERAA